MNAEVSRKNLQESTAAKQQLLNSIAIIEEFERVVAEVVRRYKNGGRNNVWRIN